MKRLKTLSVLALLLFTCAALLPAAWTSMRLTTNAGQTVQPAIAASGTNVYAVWRDDTSGFRQIYFRRSLDSGSTWQAAKKLSNTEAYKGDPAIAASGSYIYVIWSDNSPGKMDLYLRRSTDNGATWKALVQFTDNAGDSLYPAIVASNANVYVAWQDETTGNAEIYFRRSSDYGATWQTAKMITDNYGESQFPAIAVFAANVYVCWSDNTPGHYETYFKRSTDGGAHWSGARRLSVTSADTLNPAIVVYGSLIFIVDWSGYTGTQSIYFRRSTDGGATWDPVKDITKGELAPSMPVIASKRDRLYLTWQDESKEVYFTKSADGGSSWEAVQRLTYNSGDSVDPHVAVDAANVYVVFSDASPGNEEILLRYSPK